MNQPDYYTWIKDCPCTPLVSVYPYYTGAAIKYIYRHGRKPHTPAVDDLCKARHSLQLQLEYGVDIQVVNRPVVMPAIEASKEVFPIMVGNAFRHICSTALEIDNEYRYGLTSNDLRAGLIEYAIDMLEDVIKQHGLY